MIEPGLRAAIRATRNGRVGVIGTVGTISSGAYQRVARRSGAPIELTCAACPGFVEFVEAGDVDSDQVHVLAERLLAPVREAGVDTLVLGCTHYPLLARTIGDVMGRDVVLVSSADETAFAVRELLGRPSSATAHGTAGPARVPDQRRRDDVPHPGRALPRARGRRGGGLVVELTVLGCSGSYGGPRGVGVQRLPGPVGLDLDLARLRQRDVRAPPAAHRRRGPDRRRDHARAPRPLRRRLRPARPAALRDRA